MISFNLNVIKYIKVIEGERDSIGSASDLRDSEETPDDGIDEDEDEDFTQEVTAIEIKMKEPRLSKPKPMIISADDLLIGHVDGDKPLLCDEDEDVDKSPQVSHSGHSLPTLSSLSSDVFASAPFKRPLSKARKKSIPNEIESEDTKLVETTSGDEIDEEVARNMRAQVAKDSMVGPKDLFGSKPFTEQQLITVSRLMFESSVKLTLFQAEEEPQKQQFPQKQYFNEHHSHQNQVLTEQHYQRLLQQQFQQRVTVNELQKTHQSQPPIPSQPEAPPTISAKPVIINPQDMFGAVPFAATNSSIVSTTKVIAPIPPPIVSAQRPIVPPKTTKVLAAATSPPKKLIVHQTASVSIPPAVETSISPPTAIKGVKAAIKLKPKSKSSKTAKKYEVDEDDDDIDGLISNENDEELEDTKKSKKKDKKVILFFA